MLEARNSERLLQEQAMPWYSYHTAPHQTLLPEAWLQEVARPEMWTLDARIPTHDPHPKAPENEKDWTTSTNWDFSTTKELSNKELSNGQQSDKPGT